MTAAELLAADGRFTIGPGLSDIELSGIEREFGVKIPPTEIDVHLESVRTLAQYIASSR